MTLLKWIMKMLMLNIWLNELLALVTNADHLVVDKIAILTISIRKNAKFNKIIEEVNYLISNVI